MKKNVDEALSGKRKITDLGMLMGVLDKESIRHGGNRDTKR